MAKIKKQENQNDLINGQVSIWDVEITNKADSVTTVAEKVTKNSNSFSKNTVLFAKFPNKDLEIKIEKPVKSLELTLKQQEFLDKNNIMENENLSRLIKYCGGGAGIEFKYEDSFETIYINTNGEKEFSSPKKTSVLPMDNILYYKSGFSDFNNTQLEKLQEIIPKLNDPKVIKRKGDENIIIQLQYKAISINPKGWILEFNNCKVVHEEDEVEKQERIQPKDIRELQKNVKVGDVVEAKLISRTITGEITSIYGMHNMTLNISFDNHTKNTAIPRCVVIKILN
ncbi:MAG: hypothetical protein AB6733_12270 [Clostridiaceae bacterium]